QLPGAWREGDGRRKGFPRLEPPVEGLRDGTGADTRNAVRVSDLAAHTLAAVENRAGSAPLRQHATRLCPPHPPPDVVEPGTCLELEVRWWLALVGGSNADHMVVPVEGGCIDGVEIDRITVLPRLLSRERGRQERRRHGWARRRCRQELV